MTTVASIILQANVVIRVEYGQRFWTVRLRRLDGIYIAEGIAAIIPRTRTSIGEDHHSTIARIIAGFDIAREPFVVRVIDTLG